MHGTATTHGHRRRRTASTFTMGDQREGGDALEHLSRVRTGVDAAGAFLPLLIAWESQETERIHRHRESAGATPKNCGAGPWRSLPIPRPVRRIEWTEGERQEASSGRARSTTRARARGLVPLATMKEATHGMARLYSATRARPWTTNSRTSQRQARSADGLTK